MLEAPLFGGDDFKQELMPRAVEKRQNHDIKIIMLIGFKVKSLGIFLCMNILSSFYPRRTYRAISPKILTIVKIQPNILQINFSSLKNLQQ